MKITRHQLKSLILEEINSRNSLLLEMPEHPIVGQEQTGDYTKEPDEYGVDSARKALYHMSTQAQQLHDLIQEDVDLEDGFIDLIQNAAAALEKVFKTFTYDKEHPEGR
jgi:hypothetical protein